MEADKMIKQTHKINMKVKTKILVKRKLKMQVFQEE